MSASKRVLDDILDETAALTPLPNAEDLERSKVLCHAVAHGWLPLHADPAIRARMFSQFYSAYAVAIDDDPDDRDRAYGYGRAVALGVVEMDADKATFLQRAGEFWRYCQQLEEDARRAQDEELQQQGCESPSCDLCNRD